MAVKGDPRAGVSARISGDLTADHKPLRRPVEYLRTIPVLFVLLLTAYLYTVYAWFHLASLLQLDPHSGPRDNAKYVRGVVETGVFHALFLMFSVCFLRSIITSAGEIPNDDNFEVPIELNLNEFEEAPEVAAELKRNGYRRRCKWCWKYKPDRTHHCRQCRCCILKMDHHCPWIFNCVGYKNHKFFYLSLVYGALTLTMILVTQVESLLITLGAVEVRFGEIFVSLFAEVVAGLLLLVVGGFLAFHTYLIAHNVTTIEFCEKHFRKKPPFTVYDRGLYRNLRDALGENILTWPLPIDTRRGDGIHFDVASEARQLRGTRLDAVDLRQRSNRIALEEQGGIVQRSTT